jgi:hypothetical protein
MRAPLLMRKRAGNFSVGRLMEFLTALRQGIENHRSAYPQEKWCALDNLRPKRYQFYDVMFTINPGPNITLFWASLGRYRTSSTEPRLNFRGDEPRFGHTMESLYRYRTELQEAVTLPEKTLCLVGRKRVYTFKPLDDPEINSGLQAFPVDNAYIELCKEERHQ